MLPIRHHKKDSAEPSLPSLWGNRETQIKEVLQKCLAYNVQNHGNLRKHSRVKETIEIPQRLLILSLKLGPERHWDNWQPPGVWRWAISMLIADFWWLCSAYVEECPVHRKYAPTSFRIMGYQAGYLLSVGSGGSTVTICTHFWLLPNFLTIKWIESQKRIRKNIGSIAPKVLGWLWCIS
jgi:hypothetical protein